MLHKILSKSCRVGKRAEQSRKHQTHPRLPTIPFMPGSPETKFRARWMRWWASGWWIGTHIRFRAARLPTLQD